MIVNVIVLSQEIRVSVGDGQQNFRWLAKAVEGRVQYFKLLRPSNVSDNILLIGFTNSDGDLINPTDKIFEHAESNEGTVVLFFN